MRLSTQLEVCTMKAPAIVALTALASALSIGLAQAGGTDIRTGGNYDRPGRAIDVDIIKVADTPTKPSRALDDTVKTGGDTAKPGRALDDTVKTGGDTTKPGRALDDTVKTGGDTNKPGRAL